MAFGWLVASLSCMAIALIEDPNIEVLSFLTFIFSTGFWFADVMGDSLLAERAKLETSSQKGQLQSLCYACRFFMLMVSVSAATVMFEFVSASVIFWILAMLPFVVMGPTIFLFYEDRNVAVASVSNQVNEIWNTVCLRAVWQPMGFVYLYNVLQVGNAAWNQYLFTALGFSSFQLNTFLIEAYALTFAGVLIYKKYLRNTSWRNVYVWTTLLNGFFSSLQFILIFGINRSWGVSDYVFALGDDVFAELLSGIQFLPTTIMMVHLCPDGSEGAAYAMFTTVNNAALTLAGSLSSQLVHIWDVSKERFEESPPNVDGFWKLSLLTTGMQVLGLVFVPLLPHTADELADMLVGRKNRNSVGGAVFVIVLGCSILFAIGSAIFSILHG